MRVQATVEIMDRGVNMKTKPARASISLGKKPLVQNDQNGQDPKVFMVISTMNNRVGTKYPICANIQRCFDKFVGQGQCTLSLIKPAKDILISKADPVPLKAMLCVMKKILMAKSDSELDSITLTSAALNPATVSQVSKPKEKLVIVEKRDYPITKNFPCTLTILKINGINLKKFDSRILKLSQLTLLDLSDNSIPSIPESFLTLPNLRELYLSNNKIANIPVKFLTCPSISKSLCLLDMSKNQLKILPKHIGNLKNLVNLNLAHNQLKMIGMTLDKLTNLKHLELIGNIDLKVLPGSLPRLRLDHLSLSAACLTQDNEGLKLYDHSSEFPKLLDLCVAKCSDIFVRSKLDESMIPTGLLENLDTLQRCQCGKYCYMSSLKTAESNIWTSHAKAITKANPNRIAQTFVSDGTIVGSQNFIRCETFFCSTECLQLFKKRPLNFR